MNKIAYICAFYFTMLATTASATNLVLNGFASIYGGTNFEDDTVKYGYEDKMTFKNESLFGLQASAIMDDGFNATLQLVSRGVSDFDVEATWAYLSYEIDDHSSIKLGRIRVPFYEYSDFIDVRYAYPWMRPPKWTYFLPFDNYEGVGYRYLNSTDSFDYEIDIQISSSDDTFVLEDGVTEASFTSDFNALFAGKITIGDWSFRASYADFTGSTLSVGDITGLSDALIGAGFSEAGEELLLDDETITIASFGLRGDIDRFWVVGEYTILEMPVSFQTDRKNRYISVGHRWNNFNTWVTYGITSTKNHTSEILDTLPPETFVAEVTGATNVLSADIDAWSIGFRYDWLESASFKMEYTEEKDDFGQNPDGKVLTLGIDTTF